MVPYLILTSWLERKILLFLPLRGILQWLVIVWAFPIFLPTKSVLCGLNLLYKKHMYPISLSLIRCPTGPVRSWFLYTWLRNNYSKWKWTSPTDTRKAFYQNSNFAAANYNVILSPLTQMPVIGLTRIQTNSIAFKSGQGKGVNSGEVPRASSLLTFPSDSEKLRPATLDANLTA